VPRFTPVAVLLLLLTGSVSAAAADLIGVVTDRAGRPQANVLVELLGRDGQPLQPPRRAQSNAGGQFLIPNIEANVYMLRCGNRTQNPMITVSVGVVRFDCQQ
jgi:hypothetical protein